MDTGASLYPRDSAMALKVSNFDCALSAAALDHPAAWNAAFTCCSVPISIRLVMSDGLGGLSAKVWKGERSARLTSSSSSSDSSDSATPGPAALGSVSGAVSSMSISTPGS